MKAKTKPQQGLDSTIYLILLVCSTALLILLVFMPAPSQAAANAPGGGVETQSASQCPSGYLCLWSGSSYTGSFKKYSSTGDYAPITWSTVKSLWNNRSKRSFLYSGSEGGGSSACYGPGAKTGNLTGWQSSPNSAYLSLTTYCGP